MTEEKIRNDLSGINEPVLNLDFVKLGFVKEISLNGKNLKLTLGISDRNEEITAELIKKTIDIAQC